MDLVFDMGGGRGGIARRYFVPGSLDVAVVRRGLFGTEILGRVLSGLLKDYITLGAMRVFLLEVSCSRREPEAVRPRVTRAMTGAKLIPVGSIEEQTPS